MTAWFPLQVSCVSQRAVKYSGAENISNTWCMEGGVGRDKRARKTNLSDVKEDAAVHISGVIVYDVIFISHESSC